MDRTAASTPERIVTAALPLFVTHGYAGASLEKVRRDAGVSNGSLYHHFPRRADLAARLLNAGMRQCQDAVLAVLTGAGAAEDVVRSVVTEQLRWVEEHPDLARWIFSDLPDEVLLAAEPDLGADARRYAVAVGDWLSAPTPAGGRSASGSRRGAGPVRWSRDRSASGTRSGWAPRWNSPGTGCAAARASARPR